MKPTRGGSWPKLGAGILLIAGVLQAIAWYFYSDRDWFWMATIVLWQVAGVMFALWVRFLSGLPEFVRIFGSAAVVVLVGCVLQAGIYRDYPEDRTNLVMYGMMIWPGVAFLLLLWFAFLSGYPWRGRLVGVGIIALLAMSLRIDDFEGDMIPKLSFRWSGTQEAEALAYWKSQASDSEANGANADMPLPVTDEDWPGFRGAKRDGIVKGVRLARDWSTNPPKLVWKHPVGLGWSSFAVVDGLAFTQEQRLDEEVVVCYDFETGDQKWVFADPGRFHVPPGGDGPRATPTIFDSRLYALGPSGVLNCLNPRTGEKIWSHNILAEAGAENITWGLSGSPLVYDNLVVVNPGGEHGMAVIAYDRVTGEKVWGTGNGPAGYAAPRIETIDGVRQVLMFEGDKIAGYDATSGTQLWSYPWKNQPLVNAAQPIRMDDDSVFISSGYGLGAARLSITRQDGTWHADPVWTNNKLRLKFNGGVEKDGFVYGLDEGILGCFKLETGARVWKRGRYGYGQLLLVDDLLLIQDESGAVALVEASPESDGTEVARFPAIEGKTWNHPVIYRGRLLVRNAGEAACYELPLREPPEIGLE